MQTGCHLVFESVSDLAKKTHSETVILKMFASETLSD